MKTGIRRDTREKKSTMMARKEKKKEKKERKAEETNKWKRINQGEIIMNNQDNPDSPMINEAMKER